MKIFFLFYLLGSLAVAGNIRTSGDAFKKLNSSQQATVKQFVTDTYGELPTPVLQALKKFELEVQFKDFAPQAFNVVKDQCEGKFSEDIVDSALAYHKREGVFGTPEKINVIVNSLFLKPILQGRGAAEKYNCYHKNFWRLSKAVIYHELAQIGRAHV